MNYKVKVNNEAESREVQGLFFELGYKCFQGGAKIQHVEESLSSGFGYLVAWSNGCFTNVIQCGHGREEAEELTIPQLKDLVVLKHNSVDDATHVNTVTGSKVLQQGGKNYYWQDKQWNLYECGVDIEPIEAPLKEYLAPQGNEKYALTKATEKRVSDWVEVPEGAEAFYYFNNRENVFFTKHHEGEVLFSNALNDWSWDSYGDKMVGDEVLLWQRQTETDYLMKDANGERLKQSVAELKQPEALLFVDDIGDPLNKEQIEFMKGRVDKSLNNTYAEIEQVRQTKRENSHYYIDVSDVDEIDFYEIAKRYNVTDPAIQHILKKCLAVGNRGFKDAETDLKDIYKTAKRALIINNINP